MDGSNQSSEAPIAYAHTLPPPSTMADWEPLDVHAANVAKLDRLFTADFHVGDSGDPLGQWPDVENLHRFCKREQKPYTCAL